MSNNETYTPCKKCPVCSHVSYSNDIVNCLECLESDKGYIELEDLNKNQIRSEDK
jgi:acetyl-CoA carboxylase beta subunit